MNTDLQGEHLAGDDHDRKLLHAEHRESVRVNVRYICLERNGKILLKP